MPVCQLICPALTVLFVATTILGRRYSNLWPRLGYRISAVWLGVLNYTFFASCAAWIFSAAAAMVSFHIEPKVIAATFFGGAMLTSIYGLVNACWLRATRVTVKLANLPANWRGGTLALAGDLHLGNARGARFSRRVVAKVQQLQPDAVLISGDLFDGSKSDLDALLNPRPVSRTPVSRPELPAELLRRPCFLAGLGGAWSPFTLAQRILRSFARAFTSLRLAGTVASLAKGTGTSTPPAAIASIWPCKASICSRIATSFRSC